MKTQEIKITEGSGFECKVDISDLESRGWDFQTIYDDVASAHIGEIGEDEYGNPGSSSAPWTSGDAELFEKENYHVRIRVFQNGGTDFYLCQNPSYGNEEYYQGDTGDDKKTIEDIRALENEIWDLKSFDEKY